MIKPFADSETEYLYITGKSIKSPLAACKVGIRKLDYLNAAVRLDDLRIPPGNRLDALKGALKGKYSTRINDKYGIVFSFKYADAYDVLATDYH